MDASTTIDFALFLDCPVSAMRDRLTTRLTTRGAATPEDNPELTTARLQEFLTDCPPVLDVFRRSGKLRVVSSAKSVDITYHLTSELLLAASTVRPFHRTLAIVKPDAVAKGVIPDILEAIASDHLCVVHTMFVQMSDKVVEAFYAECTGKPFFPFLRDFMKSGPALVIVIEGTDAVKKWRALMGPTNTATALELAPQSIRALYGTYGHPTLALTLAPYP